MDRSWLFARLSTPHDTAAGVLTSVADGLVAHLRGRDPQGTWCFERDDDGPRPHLSLTFHATREVLGELARRLRGPAAAVELRDTYTVKDAAHGGPLSHAASDLALALLRGGERFADPELSLAVLHLRHLIGLLPAPDRLTFLFLFWQYRTRDLDRSHRRELAAQADSEAEKIVLSAAELSLAPAVADSWQGYLDALSGIAGCRDRMGARPPGYLFFHHAHLTHHRLGIRSEVDALAAMALRLSLLRE